MKTNKLTPEMIKQIREKVQKMSLPYPVIKINGQEYWMLPRNPITEALLLAEGL